MRKDEGERKNVSAGRVITAVFPPAGAARWRAAEGKADDLQVSLVCVFTKL